MPSSATLREIIRFERRTEVNDGYGNVTGAWATLLDGIPASVAPAKGNEEVLAGKLTGLTPIVIEARFDPVLAEGADRLTTADRAVNTRTGDVFDIQSIEADPRRRWITIYAEAGGVA